jgi:hypothetical protein
VKNCIFGIENGDVNVKIRLEKSPTFTTMATIPISKNAQMAVLLLNCRNIEVELARYTTSSETMKKYTESHRLAIQRKALSENITEYDQFCLVLE